MNTTARTIVGLVGLALAVLGAIALARAGLPDGQTPPHVEVLGLHRTALSALVELVLGLLFLASAAVSRDGRGVLFVGLLALVPGIVLLVAPGTWHEWVGGHRPTGALYTVAGVVTLAAAGMSLRSERRSRRLERAAGVRDRSSTETGEGQRRRAG